MLRRCLSAISATTFCICTNRTGVTGCVVARRNAVGTFQRIGAPEFFRAGEIVAGAGCVVGPHIVRLAFEGDAVCPLSGSGKFPGECETGRYPCAQQDADINDRSAGPSKSLVCPLLVEMAKIGMCKLMSDDHSKLCVAARYPQEA